METYDYIINLCPTGMVPTKAHTPHVPITPKEIIDTVVNCAELGIQMAHIHPRDAEGNPTWKPDVFKRIIGGIREQTDKVVICATTSGRNWSEFEKRSACLDLEGDYKPDMASLTVGSMNFIKNESVNSPKMIEQLALKMRDNGIKPEIEVFDPGMLHKANYLIKKGIIACERPYINILLGSLGTSPLHPASFAAFHALLPENATWSLAGIGKYQLPSNVLALTFDGNVRVGLEDNTRFLPNGPSVLCSNEQLVERIISIGLQMGKRPTPFDEVKQILGII